MPADPTGLPHRRRIRPLIPLALQSVLLRGMPSDDPLRNPKSTVGPPAINTQSLPSVPAVADPSERPSFGTLSRLASVPFSWLRRHANSDNAAGRSTPSASGTPTSTLRDGSSSAATSASASAPWPSSSSPAAKSPEAASPPLAPPTNIVAKAGIEEHWVDLQKSATGASTDRARDLADVDEYSLQQHVRNAFTVKRDMDTILSARGNLARRYLDIMQQLLDDNVFVVDGDTARSNTREAFNRYNVRRLLVKVSDASSEFPSSLFLDAVLCENRQSIGGGAFADIFRGSYDGQEVALKRLRVFQNTPETPNTFKAFCREALVWRQLRHANIQPFFGVDQTTFMPHFCMVSPWMPHGNVVDCIKNWPLGSRHLDPIPADRWALEIAQGLSYLHMEHIVHGDLRGPNILIDERLHARLTDFGLTVLADATSSGSHHGGAARWMAPELLDPAQFGKESVKPTFSSDIYSFACVCIELYTASVPFPEFRNDRQIIWPVLQGRRPPRPSTSQGEVMPDAFWELVQMCWNQAPALRPNAASVVAQLEAGPSSPLAPPESPNSTSLTPAIRFPNVGIIDRSPMLGQDIKCLYFRGGIEALYAYCDTYLIAVEWFLLGAWDQPDHAGAGGSRAVEYRTGVDVVDDVDGVASRAARAVEAHKIIAPGKSVSCREEYLAPTTRFTLTRADAESALRSREFPWSFQTKHVYQRRCVFLTEVWFVLDASRKNWVLVANDEHVLKMSFTWEIRRDEVRVSAEPVSTEPLYVEPGAERSPQAKDPDTFPYWTHTRSSKLCKDTLRDSFGINP